MHVARRPGHRAACCSAFACIALLSKGARAEAPNPVLADYNAPEPERTAVDYARAAAHVHFVNWTIWQIAWLRDKDWVPVTRDTLSDNLDAGFTFDEDVLQTNFFGHPYHGGLLFNSARGAGLSFWESLPYTLAGSLTWELFAEREPPSLNDLVATTLGGVMLGEITHRLSSEMLDDSDDGGSRLLRELGAAAIDPMRGFDRLYTGRAFSAGPPPLRRAMRTEVELGADRVNLVERQGERGTGAPALLFAVDVRYGSLLPRAEREVLGPFERFQLYAAVNQLNSSLRGAHVYASALLYGFSANLSESTSHRRDNNVFGFGVNYEYVGTNFTTYSGVGVGVLDYVVIRLGRRRELQAGLGADFVPVLGASSTAVGDSERDYNFATGLSPWADLLMTMGAFGEIGLRTRHYIATVIDGAPGEELIGSMRLWYELDLLAGLGLGVAPTLVYRRGMYRDQDDYSAQQLSTQFYLKFTP